MTIEIDRAEAAHLKRALAAFDAELRHEASSVYGELTMALYVEAIERGEAVSRKLLAAMNHEENER